MTNITIRDIVEIIALHGLCSKSDSFYSEVPKKAKEVADKWAENNPALAKFVTNAPTENN